MCRGMSRLEGSTFVQPTHGGLWSSSCNELILNEINEWLKNYTKCLRDKKGKRVKQNV